MRDAKRRRHEVLPFVRKQLEPCASSSDGALTRSAFRQKATPPPRARLRTRRPGRSRKWNNKGIHGYWFFTGLVRFLFLRTRRPYLVVLDAHPRIRDAWQRRCRNRQRKVRPEPDAGNESSSNAAGRSHWRAAASQ